MAISIIFAGKPVITEVAFELPTTIHSFDMSGSILSSGERSIACCTYVGLLREVNRLDMSLQLRFSNEFAGVSAACPTTKELFLSLIYSFSDIWFNIPWRRRVNLPKLVYLATVIHSLVNSPSGTIVLRVPILGVLLLIHVARGRIRILERDTTLEILAILGATL